VIISISLLFTKFLPFKRKVYLLLQFMVFFGYGFFQPTITGVVVVNEVFFCFIGLASLQILIEKKNEETYANLDLSNSKTIIQM